eukprot:3863457-Rhodomonas_salina.1
MLRLYSIQHPAAWYKSQYHRLVLAVQPAIPQLRTVENTVPAVQVAVPLASTGKSHHSVVVSRAGTNA